MIGPVIISFQFRRIVVEANEDGKLSVYAYVSLMGMPETRLLIYPNAESTGDETPWEIHQAAKHLRERYNLKEPE